MLKTKQVIIIGALEEGIGEATTERFLSEGYSIIGTYEGDFSDKAHNEKRKNISLYEVDHSSRESLRNFIDKISDKKIDAMVIVQMFFNMEVSATFDYEQWDKSLSVNYSSPNFLIRELINNFEEDSSIAIVTSVEGFVGSFGASAYSSTKAAVHNLVMSLANLFGSKKIRFNAVAAGWIGGVMDTDEIFNMSREITPLSRLGTPAEVASVVNFLLSNESSFINGSVITVDGGYRGVDSISKFEYLSEIN